MRGQTRPAGARAAVSTVPLLILALAAPAHAAEVHAAELEGSTNDITVERGGTTWFVFHVSATGALRCAATEEDPATATFVRDYRWRAGGSTSTGSDSTTVPFWADASCRVTWSGAPGAVPVALSLTADEDAPLGSFSFVPSVRTRTPIGSGDRLVDSTPTIVRFHVTEPAGDHLAPVVTCAGPTGARGDGDWWVGPVSYACSASDVHSGLVDPADASFSLTTSGSGAGVTTEERLISDRAGNGTPAGPYGPFDVDLDDPTIAWSHLDGAWFILGSTQTVSHACEDATSGVAGCIAHGSLDTAAVGEHVVSVLAADHAGRTTEVTHTYRVVYDVAGPWIEHPGRAHHPGRALPLSWSLGGLDDAGTYRGVQATAVSCAGGEHLGPASPAETGGYRYARGTDRHAVTVKTDRSWDGCVLLEVLLNDGTARGVVVTFR